MTRNGVVLGALVERECTEIKDEDAGLVTSVASFPTIEPADACLVTGTFRHLNRDVMEVTFANSDLVIEPTWLHPLWSLDRDGWVRAGKLEPGERLKSEVGPLVVDTVRELPSSHVVYNLEVAGDHKYLVGADGLLSHNNEGCGKDHDLVDLTEHRSEHILNRHRAGAGEPGKTEFPSDWSDEEILDHVSDVATDPSSKRGVGKWDSP